MLNSPSSRCSGEAVYAICIREVEIAQTAKNTFDLGDVAPVDPALNAYGVSYRKKVLEIRNFQNGFGFGQDTAKGIGMHGMLFF